MRCLAHIVSVFLLIGTGGFPQVQAQVLPSVQPQAQETPQPKAVEAQPLLPVNREDLLARVQKDLGYDSRSLINDWQKELDAIETGLRQDKLGYGDLNKFRDRLMAVRGKVDAAQNPVPGRFESTRAQLDRLGPRPLANQPPELEQTAQLRADLSFQLSTLEGLRREFGTLLFRCDQLGNVVQDARRKNFNAYLFQPTPNVYSRATWSQIGPSATDTLQKAENLVQAWWADAKNDEQVLIVFAETAALFVILLILQTRATARLRTWRASEPPPFWKRASSAAGAVLFRCLTVVVPILFIYNALVATHPFEEKTGWLFYAAARSIIIMWGVTVLTVTVLAPGRPHWRLIAASNTAALRLSFLVFLLAFLYGALNFVFMVTRLVQAPFSLTIIEALPASLASAFILIAILCVKLNPEAGEKSATFSYSKLFRFPLWITAISIVITALLGYLSLSRFIAQQLVVTGSILAAVYLLLLWVDSLSQALSDDHSATGRWFYNTFGFDQRRREQLAVPISLSLKFAVLLGSVPLIMLQWGYPWVDILQWYQQLFFGFQIGNTQVSLAAVIASIIVFVLAYFAARLFQSWLDAQILKPAGLSGGLRDSIRTSVGYMGVTAAALVALSYAGFSLSNLALVAGAFSVGIGFGLQSVVSNFVSGLILLAERPIKVGDLVVVGGEEGHVRKISVRSTEIETYDRGHVLIPNSYFITEKVKNWTLRNNTSRIAIGITVNATSDPRNVKDLLLKAAQDHLNVMTSPSPFVDFEEITSEGFKFKLYAFIYDINKGTETRTELRIAILEAFQQAGIAIASQHTEIAVQESAWLREAIDHYISAVNQKRVSSAPSPSGIRLVSDKEE